MRAFIQQTFIKGRQLKRRFAFPLAAALTYALATPHMVQAAENTLSLELNRTSDTANGCMLTFVAANKTGQALSNVAYEFVLFDTDGLVDKMTAFDFGALPVKKTVVRQFELGDVKCPAIGRILINGAARCDLANPQPGTEDLCIAALAPTSRSSIGFIK